MCGIAGVIRLDGSAASPDEVRRMNARIAHRGPDGEGVHAHGPVALGHRRLAIIDLEGGRQPMANEDGTAWIVFNGEIYNHVELRSELEAAGHRFATRSDTEVIVHGFEEWGASVVERLRGMFAFCVVDFRAGRALLARDPFGIKPLYLRRTARSLGFASELLPLVEMDGPAPRGSLSAVEEFLRWQYIPGPATIFDGVEKLMPGSLVELSLDGKHLEQRTWWSPDLQPRDGEERPLSLDELDAVIAESVRAHLVADVPFGVFLSGGVDSTLVAWHMARALGRDVPAFCIGFKEAEFDESAHAREAAARIGVDLHVHVVEEDSLDFLPSLVAHYGEPFGDSSALAAWHVARLARAHVPMVLSGDGGDETFAGYHSHVAWARRDPRRHVEQLRDLPARRVGARLLALRNLWNARGTGPGLDAWTSLVEYAGPSSRERLWLPAHRRLFAEQSRAFVEAAACASSHEHLPWAQAMDYRTYLPFDILPKVDVAAMYHSLEVRTPLIDRRVFEFARTIPVAQRMVFRSGGDAVAKWPLKALLERLMPPSFVHRTKQGFAIPRAKWFLEGGSARAMLDDAVARGALDGWFDPAEVRRQVALHSPARDNSNTLWLLLVLALWRARFPSVEFHA